jgi:hypothetical protein
MAKSKDAGQVYQLNITLRDIKPPVWRRVQVKDCSLAKLHDIIQKCMGWDGYHPQRALGGDSGDAKTENRAASVQAGQRDRRFAPPTWTSCPARGPARGTAEPVFGFEDKAVATCRGEYRQDVIRFGAAGSSRTRADARTGQAVTEVSSGKEVSGPMSEPLDLARVLLFDLDGSLADHGGAVLAGLERLRGPAEPILTSSRRPCGTSRTCGTASTSSPPGPAGGLG